MCAIAVYLVVPGLPTKDLIYSVVGAAATMAVLAGVRLHRPASARGWYLVAGANACFVVGDAVLDVYDVVLHTTAPFPSVADAVYLSGYPLLFAGVVAITRPVGRRAVRDSWTYALAVCVGTLGLVWHFLMGPTLEADPAADPMGTLGKLVTMAYPVMDLGVLSAVAGALLWGSARRRSDQLLVAAVAVMLAFDFVYELQTLHGTYYSESPVNAGFLLNYVLIAAAALHPSMGAAPGGVEGPDLQRRRWLPLVAGAALLSPVIMLITGLDGLPVDLPVLSATSLVVFALITYRVSGMFAQIRRQNQVLQEQSSSLRAAIAAQQVLQDDLQHQALHDGLTGMANRWLLQERVKRALTGSSSKRIVALCFCDLDDFKAVNDRIGHQAGDELLVVVGKRINSIVRGVATVARLGGDEFAVLLEDAEQSEAASVLAERIVSVLREPVRLGDHEIRLSASVGVAVAEADTTTQQLLSEADAAMYEAKAAGKNRVVVFETVLRARLLEKMALVNCFPGSLHRSEFFLEYQPLFRLSDQRLEGFESLVRWRHPTLGQVEPGRFIPLAEDTRFIVPLGGWILAAACREAATWPVVAGAADAPLSVSVNLSGWQLQDPCLLETVREALTASGLPPQRLVLEVTESVLMVNPAGTAEVLSQIRMLGVRVAIDDFGTGFSSLSHLRQLPVDILKIDKSFIDPLNDPHSEGDAFVATIVRLAADLRLRTVAEGIEHGVQRDALIRLGCQSGQGYLMSAALGTDATRRFIESRCYGQVPADPAPVTLVGQA